MPGEDADPAAFTRAGVCVCTTLRPRDPESMQNGLEQQGAQGALSGTRTNEDAQLVLVKQGRILVYPPVMKNVNEASKIFAVR